MFDLTVEGIEDAMDYLRKGSKNMYTTVQMLKGLKYYLVRFLVQSSLRYILAQS